MSTPLRIRRREAGPAGEWPGDYPDLLRRLHAARGARNPLQALPRLTDLPPPDAMPGIDAAVALLEDALARPASLEDVA